MFKKDNLFFSKNFDYVGDKDRNAFIREMQRRRKRKKVRKLSELIEIYLYKSGLD